MSLKKLFPHSIQTECPEVHLIIQLLRDGQARSSNQLYLIPCSGCHWESMSLCIGCPSLPDSLMLSWDCTRYFCSDAYGFSCRLCFWESRVKTGLLNKLPLHASVSSFDKHVIIKVPASWGWTVSKLIYVVLLVKCLAPSMCHTCASFIMIYSRCNDEPPKNFKETIVIW